MEESKKEILKELLKLLRMTRAGCTLVDLEYEADLEVSNIEIVIATFQGGGRKIIDVTADSGVAMIKDVIRRIE